MKTMRLLCAIVSFLCASFQLQARPYASGLTNSGTAISFRLNESADSVKVISAGGTVTNELGALDAGSHTFPLALTGPYQVEIFKVSQPGFIAPIGPNRAAVLQISTDTNLVRFNNPRGVAVNTDPASPYFGRVYVSNTSVTNTPFARPVGDGIYVLNADLSDALGQGDTALTGGLNFVTGAAVGDAVSPYRLMIGRGDNNLYISDFSDANGSVYVTDPDVSAASGQNVLGGPAGSTFPVTVDKIHGSIGGLWVEGSLPNGDLTVFDTDEDLQTDPAATARTQCHSLWRHDIGATLPGPFVMPTRVAPHANAFLMTTATQTMDLDRDTNGTFFVMNYRSVGNEANVWMADTNGAIVWSSLLESRALAGSSTAPDFLRAAGGIALSPMGDYLAVINIETNGIAILPILDGKPDITNRLYFQGMGTTTAQGRDVAFDAAGNLYAVSSGAGLLRVFSPGGTSTAITGSDGTFRVLMPASVSAGVEDSQGYETGADVLSFKVTRTGSTAEDLTVNLTWSGTATNGVDYVTAPGTIVIPAGQSEVVLDITPIDDAEAELTETVILTVGVSPDYNLGSPIVGTGTISDNETPVVLRIRPSDTNAYERFPSDTLSFTITRLGDTNTFQFVSFNLSGGATLDVDYSRGWGDQLLVIPEGVVSTNILLAPIDDFQFEGDEFVTVSLATSTEYQIEAPGSASGRIRDDEYPAEAVVFSDNFNANSSADWGLMFWASNDIPDYTVDWAFDYSALGIPPAPGSLGVDTLGVRIAVNKNDATARGAAAVNLYPTNQTFSGDYALRFDLYLQHGTAATTEHALAGINHSGQVTNRMDQSDAAAGRPSTHGADGLWIAIENDGSANREWTAYTSTNSAAQPHVITNRTAAAVASLVPSPPYAVAGSPGNTVSSATKTWAQVEISQVGNVVTLQVNQNVIYRITNTFGFNSGTIMIGHSDQFDSVGSSDNFAIFDNVRVIRLGPGAAVNITNITVSGNTVQLDFVSPDGGVPTEFRVESTPTLSPPVWTEESVATVSATPNGFRATMPTNGAMRFYRVRR